MGWNIHWTSEKGYIPVALKNHYDEKKCTMRMVEVQSVDKENVTNEL
jgi:hypothetical protein